MKHKPMERQRSKWREFENADPQAIPGRWYARGVRDGTLYALVAKEPKIGWHLSISHRGNSVDRYPTWDEQVHAVRQLLPADLTYAMYLPPDAEYVAVHDTTFHWHEVINDVR